MTGKTQKTKNEQSRNLDVREAQAAVTMLDCEGSPVRTAPPKAGSSKGRVGGKMHLEDVSLGVKASPPILNQDSQRGS